MATIYAKTQSSITHAYIIPTNVNNSYFLICAGDRKNFVRWTDVFYYKLNIPSQGASERFILFSGLIFQS